MKPAVVSQGIDVWKAREITYSTSARVMHMGEPSHQDGLPRETSLVLAVRIGSSFGHAFGMSDILQGLGKENFD